MRSPKLTERITFVSQLAAICVLWTTIGYADCSNIYFAYAQDSLILRDNTHVGAKRIGASAYVEVGANAQVHSRVAAAQLYLRSGALLNGVAYTDNPVATQMGAIQTGLTLPLSGAPDCTPPTVPLASPGSADVWISSFQILPPGNYRQINVGVGATLVLSGGDYHFENLYIQPDTRLVVRWEGRPARLLASQAVYFGDRHEQSVVALGSLREVALQVYTPQVGQLRLGTDSQIEAQIVAPSAELVVSPRTVVKAPLYSWTLLVEPDATLGRYVDINPTICGQ